MKKLIITLILVTAAWPSRADWASFNAQRVSAMNAEEIARHSGDTNSLGQVSPRVKISDAVPMLVTNALTVGTMPKLTVSNVVATAVGESVPLIVSNALKIGTIPELIVSNALNIGTMPELIVSNGLVVIEMPLLTVSNALDVGTMPSLTVTDMPLLTVSNIVATAIGESVPLVVSNATITSPTMTAADGSTAVETVRIPAFSGGTVSFTTGFWDWGTAPLASPAIACSNAHVVALFAQATTIGFATSITFKVELSPDGGSTWYSNDDMQYVADTGLAETNRYFSVSADGATHARVLISSPTNVALVSTDLVWRVKQ